MQLFYTDHFELPLPVGHRFPMVKYRMLRERLACDPFFQADSFVVPPAATIEQLCLAHDATYVSRVLDGSLSVDEVKRIGFPWSEKMVERSRRSSGATLAAARVALRENIAVNLAGGTHHAMRAAGEGYCVFNDAAITLRTLFAERRIARGLVIDCDVHQGNGTADILGSDHNMFTFSIHGEKNFPLRKCPGHLDINLPDGTGDTAYLDALQRGLDGIFSTTAFDIAIYLAGADPYEKDRLGRLSLSKQGLLKRDELVLARLSQERVPVAIAMAGGYASDVADIVDIHFNTVRIAKQFWNHGPSMK